MPLGVSREAWQGVPFQQRVSRPRWQLLETKEVVEVSDWTGPSETTFHDAIAG